jgi:hypothetical protein
MYSSSDGVFNVDENFVEEVEPLLLENKVSPFGLTSDLCFDCECTLPLLDFWCEIGSVWLLLTRSIWFSLAMSIIMRDPARCTKTNARLCLEKIKMG